jgi:hypothetical protein
MFPRALRALAAIGEACAIPAALLLALALAGLIR